MEEICVHIDVILSGTPYETIDDLMSDPTYSYFSAFMQNDTVDQAVRDLRDAILNRKNQP